MVYAGGSTGAGVYAAIANAIKASGVVVRVEPEDFMKILDKHKEALVVTSKGGFLKANHQYLTSYKGLAFFTKCSTPLMLPGSAEVIITKQIWIPM